MFGLVSGSREKVYPHLFADAVFAGDVDTQRSTSALYSVVRGPHTLFPLSAANDRQTCVSHSTLEVEVELLANRFIYSVAKDLKVSESELVGRSTFVKAVCLPLPACFILLHVR